MVEKNVGSQKPKENPESRKGVEKMAEEKPKRIMVEPLPKILDEIEDSIRQAYAAAEDARAAAEEARRAGEKAASEAARVAAQAIAKVEQLAQSALQLAELINATALEAAGVIEKRLPKK